MISPTRTIFLTLAVVGFGSCIQTSEPEATVQPDPAPENGSPTQDKPAEPASEASPVMEADATRVFALREQGRALIYDVRLPLYYKLGHIDGAILFYPKPFDEAFEREKPRMEKALSDGKTIILYCGGADCNDSHIVARMIAERGIPVTVYSGGWAEWKVIGIE